jgi:hypothetical protein
MLGKRIIRDYLYKVKDRAVHSVTKQYDQKIHDQRIAILKNDVELSKQVEELQKHVSDMLPALLKFQKRFKDFEIMGYYSMFQKLYKPNSINSLEPESIADYITQYFSEPSLTILTKEKDEHVKATEAEYNKLIKLCDNISAKAMLKYLESIGFDVTWICTQANITIKDKASDINKDNLFVCGDNKF